MTAALSVSTDAEAVGLSTRLKEGREGADAYLAALEEAIYQALLVRTGRMDAEALKAYPALWRTAAERAPGAGSKRPADGCDEREAASGRDR